jgi:hypothetical protein
VPGEVSISGSLNHQLWHGIHSFTAWLARAGDESHDPYDLWGTHYGLFARRLYYQKNPIGLLLIAPIVAAETLFPSVRKWFVRKQRFATADAQLLLAFLNLHALGSTGASPVPPGDSPGDSPLRLESLLRIRWGEGGRRPDEVSSGEWGEVGEVSKSFASPLHRARSLADDLLATSIPGYAGHCWGYPFDWQNNRGLWKRNTPFITSTPYCYEAFAKLSEATGDSTYLEVAESVARFVFQNLNDTPTGENSAAASYGPLDHTHVINASAYRAFVLFDAARRFGKPEYEEKAHANLNFILQSQLPDGSWLYALNSPAEAFIDHFHTCFVLKNLLKINEELDSDAVNRAIERGYAWYRRELFDADGLPKSFAIQPRTQLVRLEMYNFAEAITLGVLLRNIVPGAFADAQRLARILIDDYQLRDGHFVTRVLVGGLLHTFPFLRWPQAQLFYALTNLLHALSLSASNPFSASDGEKVAEGRMRCPRESGERDQG